MNDYPTPPWKETKRSRTEVGKRWYAKPGPDKVDKPAWLREAKRLQKRGHDFVSIGLLLDLTEATVRKYLAPGVLAKKRIEKPKPTAAQREKDRDRKRAEARRKWAEMAEQEKKNGKD